MEIENSEVDLFNPNHSDHNTLEKEPKEEHKQDVDKCIKKHQKYPI